jgi:hypothetical protein
MRKRELGILSGFPLPAGHNRCVLPLTSRTMPPGPPPVKGLLSLELRAPKTPARPGLRSLECCETSPLASPGIASIRYIFDGLLSPSCRSACIPLWRHECADLGIAAIGLLTDWGEDSIHLTSLPEEDHGGTKVAPHGASSLKVPIPKSLPSERRPICPLAASGVSVFRRRLEFPRAEEYHALQEPG